MQDFYPTPGTVSTVMFYTGINPMTKKSVYVCTDYHEKQLQRALLQFSNPKNKSLVIEALKKAGREDLIGFGDECLVKPMSQGRKDTQSERNRADSKKSVWHKGRTDKINKSIKNSYGKKNTGNKNITKNGYSLPATGKKHKAEKGVNTKNTALKKGR